MSTAPTPDELDPLSRAAVALDLRGMAAYARSLAYGSDGELDRFIYIELAEDLGRQAAAYEGNSL